jgi:hypothetical protein
MRVQRRNKAANDRETLQMGEEVKSKLKRSCARADRGRGM